MGSYNTGCPGYCLATRQQSRHSLKVPYACLANRNRVPYTTSDLEQKRAAINRLEAAVFQRQEVGKATANPA
jgi:hypothetical protein